MADLNKLCHVKNANDLAHKKDADALIYKGVGKAVYIDFSAEMAEWTCMEYDVTHDISYSFYINDSGALSTDGGKHWEIQKTTANMQVPGTVTMNTGCASDEEPQPHVQLVVSQPERGKVETADFEMMRTSSTKSFTIKFDKDGVLSGIES